MTAVVVRLELVVVFLKYPEPGRVKTRLAAALGPDRAAEIYRELVVQTLGAVGEWVAGEPAAGPERHVWIAYDPPHRCADTQAWLSAELRRWRRPPGWVAQSEGDLGRRMEHVFHQGFADGYSAVIAIGTDCPDLSADGLSRAAFDLRTHPGVLGPSADGGYYLIGVNSHRPELFLNIPWSSPETGAATVAAAQRAGWQFQFLPTLSDIDTHDDWCQWSARTPREVSKRSGS